MQLTELKYSPTTVFKISAGPRTLTVKIWVGLASFPSLSYTNFGKIMLRPTSSRSFFEDCNNMRQSRIPVQNWLDYISMG